MVDKKLLDKYRKFKDSCDYCYFENGKGHWCKRDNIKCSLNTCKALPFISCGKSNNYISNGTSKGGNDFRGITGRQLEAFKLREEGLSFSEVGSKLGITKTSAYKLYNKAKMVYKAKGDNDKGGGITSDKRGGNDLRFRLHNDVVNFLIEPIEFFGESNEVKLRYTSYLLVNTVGEHIKIFSKKLVVRFRDDIFGVSVEDVKARAEERIKNFLKSFSYRGVNLTGSTTQISRHYALLGTELAKKFIKEREKIYVYDRGDGKRRIAIDFSNEKPELEFEHLVKGDSDGEKWKDIIEDASHNRVYKLSSMTNMIDGLMSDYIKTIELFDSRMNWMAKNNESHQRVLEKMEKNQDETLKTLNAIKDFMRDGKNE